MSRVRGLLPCVWLLLPVAAHSLDDDPASSSVACPGAVAWKQAHPYNSAEAIAQRDQARTFSKPQLRKELEERFNLDQSVRKELLQAPNDRTVLARVDSVDADNLAWLKKLFRGDGIPTADQVGEQGIKWVWLLVQHADRDPKLQASALPQFAKRYEAGELPADDLAKLTDRLLIALGKPQVFGTQFDWFSGKFDLRTVGDIAAIDAHREKVGLMPLSDYACLMNERLKRN
jgi:hypothetical protein